MADKEFNKIFLEIENVYRLDGDLFGSEWDKVRRQQIGFLLERPLMFKVLTEKAWGPAKLDNLSTDEWWEAEQEERGLNKPQEIEELADMALLFLTMDSFNPDLSLASQKELLRLGWNDTVRSYCDEIEIDRNDLVPIAEKKIKINELRNPQEAFTLVAGENMHISNKRMEHNWLMLKNKRHETKKRSMKKGWWKKSLYIDESGWVRETEKTD